jgi:lipoprotein-anchoring transpeptidase ErfK/SrfK
VSAKKTVRPDGRILVRLAAVGFLAALAGCTTANVDPEGKPIDPLAVAMYAPVQGEPFRVPAVPINKVDAKFYRQTVATPPNIPNQPGTIVVDPYDKFLYLVQDDGQSLRYGIGVGKQGFAWSGTAEIQDKQEWPKWFPPVDMQARDAYAAKFADGMDGGPKNPLGSRALYLYEGKCHDGNIRTANCQDTLYRIHGTSEPLSIGKAVSSGCIRMWNQDVMDLYNRVDVGTKVVVLAPPEGVAPDGVPLDAPGVAGAPMPAPGAAPLTVGTKPVATAVKPVAAATPQQPVGAI